MSDARQRGRPRLKSYQRRSATIIVRVDATEREMAEFWAKESGMKLSEWARRRIFAGVVNVDANSRNHSEAIAKPAL